MTRLFGPREQGEGEGIGGLGAFSRLFFAQPGTQSKDLLDTRWARNWKGGEGEETVQARLVATGYQDPDLRSGNVDITGCASRRSSHFQVISWGP